MAPRSFTRVGSLPPDSALGDLKWTPHDFGGTDCKDARTKRILSFTIPSGPADEEKGRSERSLSTASLSTRVSVALVPSDESGESSTGGDDELDDLYFGDGDDADDAEEEEVDEETRRVLEEEARIAFDLRQRTRVELALSRQLSEVHNFDFKGRQRDTIDLSHMPMIDLPHEISELQYARRQTVDTTPTMSAPHQAHTTEPVPLPRTTGRQLARSQTTPTILSSSPSTLFSQSGPSNSPSCPTSRHHSRSTSGHLAPPFASLSLSSESDTLIESDESDSPSSLPAEEAPISFEKPFEKLPVGIILSHCSLTTSSLTYSLFSITNLTNLTLRDNNLESLPPSICRLVNLTHLVVANNKLKFLPAEVMSLKKLERLVTACNPWLTVEVEEEEGRSITKTTSNGRILGPKKTHFQLPSLVEICTRYLLTKEDDVDATRRISNYELPTLHDHIKAPFLLCPTTTSSSSSSTTTKLIKRSPATNFEQPFDPEANCCIHKHGDGLKERVPFCKHAVERIEWVGIRRLQQGASTAGGDEESTTKKAMKEERIPILWRGCGVKCLDWLEV